MTPPRLFLTLVAVLTPAAALAQPGPGFPGMEPPPQRTITFEGNEVFRWLLHRAELKPLTDEELTRRSNNPTNLKDTVVIVFSNPHNGWVGGRQSQSWLDLAVSNGGAALLACDQPASVPLSGFPINTEVQFSGQRVAAFPPAEAFNRDPNSPFLEPIELPNRNAPEWRLFGGDQPLARITTHHPSVMFTPTRGGFERLARFPRGCLFNNGAFLNPNSYVFAVGKSGLNPRTQKPYRFLALADQAVFSNGLMAGTDADGPTDNLEFADRVVTYLTEENGAKARTKCLLIVNGQMVRNYDELNGLLRPPMPLPKLPPWDKLQPKLIDMGNEILDKLQQNDVPNRLFQKSNPDEPGSWFRTFLGVLLTAAALWAVLALVRRVWGARAATDRAPAPPDGRPPPPADGAAGVFGRRGKELVARDNLLEPARAACRDLFDTIGGPPDPGPRLPKLVISAVVRRPETLRQALRDLWAVAYGRPAPVSALRWAMLEPLVTRARTAHEDGKWRFAEADAWAVDSTRLRGEA